MEQTIYLLLGVAGTADFNNYSSFFTNTQQSFKELTDPSKLNKKPERVRLRTVGSARTLEQALRNGNVAEKRLEELAILNGMKLTDKVEQGNNHQGDRLLS